MAEPYKNTEPLLKVEHLKKYYPQNRPIFGRPTSWIRRQMMFLWSFIRGKHWGWWENRLRKIYSGPYDRRAGSPGLRVHLV